MKPIRIIIASPRPVQRSRLAKLLATHPALTVIAQAADMSETYTLAEKLGPDLVLLAEDYTRLAEFAGLESEFSVLEAAWMVIRTPEAGPSPARHPDPGKVAIESGMALTEIVERIEAAMATRGAASPLVPAKAGSSAAPQRPDRVVLIGSSTGGIDALLTVLASFPVDCPPTAIVQHTGRGHSDSLIALLDRRCPPRVVAAEDGARLQAGTVHVAAGTDGHLRLLGGAAARFQISPGRPVSGHVPSVDELFRSALPIADRVIAALLTGMGRDGAEGMLALRHAGATTIGQDEATAVVYGMPRAAVELGGVEMQLPLNLIGPEILRRCQPASPVPALREAAIGKRVR